MALKVQIFGAELLKKVKSCLLPHDWPSCRSVNNLSTPKHKVTALCAYSTLYGNTMSYCKLYSPV
eukprot:12916238-Ditylum_brightwellii.AAC.1